MTDDTVTDPQTEAPPRRGPGRPPKTTPADAGDGMAEVIVMNAGVCIDGGAAWATEADAKPHPKGARLRITAGEAEFLASREQVAII